MLEAGVPVVYGYIEDAHDNQGQALSGVSTSVEKTFGPGAAGFVTQLRAFNKAFGNFLRGSRKTASPKIIRCSLSMLTRTTILSVGRLHR